MKKQLLTILAGAAFFAQANDSQDSVMRRFPNTQNERRIAFTPGSRQLTDVLLSECKQAAAQPYLAIPFLKFFYKNSTTLKQMLDEKNYDEISLKASDGQLFSQFNVKKSNGRKLSYNGFVNEPLATIKSEISCQEAQCGQILAKLFELGPQWIDEKTNIPLVDGYSDKFTRCEKSTTSEGDNKSVSYSCETIMHWDDFKKSMK